MPNAKAAKITNLIMGPRVDLEALRKVAQAVVEQFAATR